MSSAEDLSHAEARRPATPIGYGSVIIFESSGQVSGFSWMPSIENFIGRNAKARKSYNEALHAVARQYAVWAYRRRNHALGAS